MQSLAGSSAEATVALSLILFLILGPPVIYLLYRWVKDKNNNRKR